MISKGTGSGLLGWWCHYCCGILLMWNHHSTGLCYACRALFLLFKIQGERAVYFKQPARRWTLNHSLLFFSSVSIILADLKLWRLRKNEFHGLLKHASTGLISCHGTRHLWLFTIWPPLASAAQIESSELLWLIITVLFPNALWVMELWVWCQAVLCIQGVKLLHSAWLLTPHLLKPNLIRWQASLKFDIDRIICTLCSLSHLPHWLGVCGLNCLTFLRASNIYERKCRTRAFSISLTGSSKNT